jgi:uncharacterized membrane protein HdeD (DUF308 family)
MRSSSVSNITGIIFIILGILSIIYPLYSSLGVEVFFGALFLFGGIFHLFGAFEKKHHQNYIWNFAVGVFYTLAGVYLLGNPIGGLLSLTVVLIILFYIQGILTVFYGLYQGNRTKTRAWIVFNGLITVLIATILLIAYPISALWALGILVGVNLFMFGVSILVVNRLADEIEKK